MTRRSHLHLGASIFSLGLISMAVGCGQIGRPDVTVAAEVDKTGWTFTIHNQSGKYIQNATVNYKGYDQNHNWYYDGNETIRDIQDGQTKSSKDIFVITNVPQYISVNSIKQIYPDRSERQLSFKFLK